MLKNEIKGMKERAQETEIKVTKSYLITAGCEIKGKREKARNQVTLQSLLKLTHPPLMSYD